MPERHAAEHCPQAVAEVDFVGPVRDHNHGRDMTGPEYSAYRELAQREGERIMSEAVRRFGLHAA